MIIIDEASLGPVAMFRRVIVPQLITGAALIAITSLSLNPDNWVCVCAWTCIRLLTVFR